MRRSVFLLLVFAVGTAGGYFLVAGPRRDVSSGQGETRAAVPEADSVEVAGLESTDRKVLRLVTAARRKGGDELERSNELYLAIEALSADDLSRLLNDFGKLQAMIRESGDIDPQTIAQLASGLTTRWLKVSPEGALDWLPHVLDLVPEGSRWSVVDTIAAKRPELILAVVSSRKNASEREGDILRALAELAAKDLPKAKAWLNACSDPADRKTAEKAIRRGIVKADPLRLIEIGAEITDAEEQDQIAEIAAQQAAKIGPGMLRQLATQPMKSWMLHQVFRFFADHDPELAVELALNSEAEGWDKQSALQSAFEALASRDHEQAIAKLKGLEGEELTTAFAQIGYRWAKSEPEAALAWLAERPATERNDPQTWSYGSRDALLVAYSDWVENAPEAARTWADALPPGETRDAVQTQRARILAASGAVEEATRVLSQLGDSADKKALSTIASAWAERAPAAAAEWAISQPAGAPQGRAIASVVGTWANNDPQSAAAWLEQFPPGEARDRSIAAFLGRTTAWTSGQEAQIAEFDAWFGRIDDPWQRAQAAVRSYYARRNANPESARQWLLSVQNVDPGVIKLALVGERRR